MASIRPLLFSLLIPLVACGGDDTSDDGVTPTGEHYKYVAKEVKVPSRASEPAEFGLDLDGDATVDNQLGTAIVTLGTALNNPAIAKDAVNVAVQDGTIILLGDLQTESFTSTAGAGFEVLLGANPSPAPCTTPADPTTCGKHLAGNGMFSVDGDTPGALTGPIVNGTFKGGPGELTLQIALNAGAQIELDLIGARVEGSAMSATGGTFKVGGAVSEEDFDSKVLPAIKTAVIDPILATGCAGGAGADHCMCTGNAKMVITLLDKPLDAGDCMITVEEIKTNPTLMPLIQPDVTIGGVSAISIGIVAITTTATFDN